MRLITYHLEHLFLILHYWRFIEVTILYMYAYPKLVTKECYTRWYQYTRKYCAGYLSNTRICTKFCTIIYIFWQPKSVKKLYIKQWINIANGNDIILQLSFGDIHITFVISCLGIRNHEHFQIFIFFKINFRNGAIRKMRKAICYLYYYLKCSNSWRW